MRWPWQRAKVSEAPREIAVAEVTETKTSAAGPLIVLGRVGQPAFTGVKQLQFSKEGYQQNVIAFRCIERIARSAATVPWILRRGKTEVDDPKHPLAVLLQRPNAKQSGFQFFERVVAFKCIHGNSFIEQVCDGTETTPSFKQPPRELYSLRPDRMKVIPGLTGLPMAYRFEGNGQPRDWPADIVNGASAIIHWMGFSPLDEFYGMSAMQPAGHPIDQHNASSEMNTALLQNGAQPPGFIRYKPTGDKPVALTPQQKDEARSQLIDRYAGPHNQGKTPIVSGDFEWVKTGFSPREMEWIEGHNEAARDICRAFGVPPMMLGIPGDNTYSNQREARCSFYEDTVLPMLDDLADVLNHWVTPCFGDDLTLAHDLDEIPALAPKREAKFQMVVAATFMTTNEKREATGYDKITGNPAADEVLVPSTMVPLTDAGMTTENAVAAGLRPDPSQPPPDPNADPADNEADDSTPPDSPKKAALRRRKMIADLLHEGFSVGSAKDITRMAFERVAP